MKLGILSVGVKWAPLEGAVNIPIHRPSPLGNPFVISAHKTRKEACAQYEEWLMEELNKGNQKIHKEMEGISFLLAQGKNVNLTCFCKGKGYEDRQCHGEIILSIISEHLLEYQEIIEETL